MNYLSEILAFNNWIRYNSAINKSDICLWHSMMFIANDLMSKCIPVLFTNLFEISKAVKSTFNRESSQTEQNLIDKFSNIEVLFLTIWERKFSVKIHQTLGFKVYFLT